MRRYAFLSAIVLVAIALFASSCARKPSADSTGKTADIAAVKPVSVSVLPVAPRDMEAHVQVTGTLHAANEVTVGTRIAGRVTWIIGKEGTPVKKGSVVVRMDDMDAKTQVLQAQSAVEAAASHIEQARATLEQQKVGTDSGIRSAVAGVQAARAKLEEAKAAAQQQLTATDAGIKTADAGVAAANARYQQAVATADATDATATAQVKSATAALDAANIRLKTLRNGSRTQERAVAESAVRQAKANYDNDKSNYDRYKALYDEKAIARSLLDSAETKMKISADQLTTTQEQLSLVKEGPRAEDIQGAEAEVRQAEEGVQQARANLKQIDVAKANVEIARTGVEQAKAAVDTARASRQVDIMRDKDVMAANAAVQQAEQALQEAYATRHLNVVRQTDLLAAQSAYEQAKQAKALALQNLDYTLIYSPVDGVVSKQLTDIGSSLGSGKDLMSITTNQTLYFEANVSELDATQLRAGQPVSLSVDALQGGSDSPLGAAPRNSVLGTVEKVVPVVDAHTRDFVVRVIVARYPSATAVLKEALVDKGDKQVVFVADNGHAQQREVKTGVIDGAYVQLLSGVLPGDQVITVGQQTLANNDPIEIAEKHTGQ